MLSYARCESLGDVFHLTPLVATLNMQSLPCLTLLLILQPSDPPRGNGEPTSVQLCHLDHSQKGEELQVVGYGKD